MNPRWLFPPLLGLAAFAAGWLAGGPADGLQNGSAKGSPANATSRDSAPRHGAPIGADDTPPSKILAFRQAVLLPAGLSRTCAIADALDALTLEDLPAVLAVAPREPQEFAEKVVADIFQHWTRLDRKSAGAAAHAMPDFWLQQSANLSVATEWAKTDAPATLAWIRTLTPLERSCNGFNLTLYAFVDWQGDPATAMRTALALPGELLGDSRTRDLSGLVQNIFSPWAKRDPQATMAFATGLADPAIRKQALKSSAYGWAERDLPGAVAWLRGVTDEKVLAAAEPEIMDHLALTNPADAVEFARALPAGARRDLVLAGVLSSLKNPDAKLVATLVAELPLDVGNDKVIQVYQTWIELDPPAALRDFFSKLGANAQESEKAELVKHLDLMVKLADKDTTDALARIPDGPENALRDRLLAERAAGLGAKDSAKARAWAEKLPPGSGRAVAFQGIMDGWASSAANEAAEWLQSLPAGPDRTGAITGFVGATFDQDPAGALAWVQTIPDAAARERALDTAWHAWAGRTRASAEQWRNTASELTAAQRARLK